VLDDTVDSELAVVVEAVVEAAVVPADMWKKIYGCFWENV
jgi:hypothetical protein